MKLLIFACFQPCEMAIFCMVQSNNFYTGTLINGNFVWFNIIIFILEVMEYGG